MAFPGLGWGGAANDCAVCLFYLVSFQGAVQGAGGIAIDTEEKDAGGWPVDAVDVVDVCADLVAQDFHRHQVTVLWIVVLTNAMNFLDNMDALSAGIGLIACLLFAGILLTLVPTPHWAVAFGLLITAGSLGGFLVWNRPPASIFMGQH